MQVGTKVRTTGKGWSGDEIPRGTEGRVVRVWEGAPFPFECTFNVPNGTGFLMLADEIEEIL